MAKTIYSIHIDYKTGQGKPGSTTIDVEATSAKRAKSLASQLFANDYRRRNSRITRLTHVGGTVAAPPQVFIDNRPIVIVPCDEPKPFKVGDNLILKQGEFRGPVVIRSFFVDGKGVKRFVIERAGYAPTGQSRFSNPSEERLRQLTQPEERTIYKIVYPDGRVFESTTPYINSTYGIDQLIQIKVTTVDGKIVDKELVK